MATSLIPASLAWMTPAATIIAVARAMAVTPAIPALVVESLSNITHLRQLVGDRTVRFALCSPSTGGCGRIAYGHDGATGW
jgi:hypothetical protein